MIKKSSIEWRRTDRRRTETRVGRPGGTETGTGTGTRTEIEIRTETGTVIKKERKGKYSVTGS